MKNIIFIILRIITIIIMIPLVILGFLLLAVGTLIKSIGYMLCLDKESAADIWIDFSNDVRSLTIKP